MSLTFAQIYCVVEIANIGLCDRAFGTTGYGLPLISSRNAVYIVFLSSLILGMIFGALFGAFDNSTHSKMGALTLLCMWKMLGALSCAALVIGFAMGSITGLINGYLFLVEERNAFRALHPPSLVTGDETVRHVDNSGVNIHDEL